MSFSAGEVEALFVIDGPRVSSGCGSIDKQAESKQGGEEADLNSVVEQVVLEQFKHGGTAKGDCVGPHSVGEVESGDMTDVQGSRKRKSLEGLLSRFESLTNLVHCFVSATISFGFA